MRARYRFADVAGCSAAAGGDFRAMPATRVPGFRPILAYSYDFARQFRHAAAEVAAHRGDYSMRFTRLAMAMARAGC